MDYSKYDIEIKLSENFTLCLYKAIDALSKADKDAKIFDNFCSNDIMMSIPDLLFFSNSMSTNTCFQFFPIMANVGAGLALALRNENDNFAGLIILNSPMNNGRIMGKNIWTIQFFILEPFRMKKIMNEALKATLEICKDKLDIEKIYACAYKEDKRSTYILEKFGFKNVQDDVNGHRSLFECKL